MNIGIYQLLNTVNGHRYVGLSTNLKQRKADHFSKWHRSNCKVVGRAIAKHGIQNFRFEILEHCAKEILSDRERFWVAELKPEYNRTEGGEVGYTLTGESRDKISNSLKAHWRSLSAEVKTERLKNLLANRNPSARTGTGWSLEARRRISERLKGRKNGPHSELTKTKIGMANGVPVMLERDMSVYSFCSIGLAAREMGISTTALYKAAKHGGTTRGFTVSRL